MLLFPWEAKRLHRAPCPASTSLTALPSRDGVELCLSTPSVPLSSLQPRHTPANPPASWAEPSPSLPACICSTAMAAFGSRIRHLPASKS